MNEYDDLTIKELEQETTALKHEIEKLQRSLQEMQRELDNKRGVLWFDPWLAPEGYVAIITPKCSCDECAFWMVNNCTIKNPKCIRESRPDRKDIVFIPVTDAIEQWMEQSRIEHGVFLDGKKARAYQKPDAFWMVRRQDGKGGDVEYSDMAVKHTLLEDKGRFVST